MAEPSSRVEAVSEEDFASTPDALAGRARLEAGLERLSEDERAAFREAVRRCYASALEETPGFEPA